MSDTGATPEQVEAASLVLLHEAGLRRDGGKPTRRGKSISAEAYRREIIQIAILTHRMLGAAVPPDHRIIGPEAIAALGRVLEMARAGTRYPVDDDMAVLAALTGKGGEAGQAP